MSKTATGGLETLRSNPDWAKLPLFDRKGWKRVRFGDVVQTVRVEAKGVTRAGFVWRPAGEATIK